MAGGGLRGDLGWADRAEAKAFACEIHAKLLFYISIQCERHNLFTICSGFAADAPLTASPLNAVSAGPDGQKVLCRARDFVRQIAVDKSAA